MIIAISPQTETLLKEQAKRLGQDTDTLADVLLRQALEDASQDFEESCAAIGEALAGNPANDMSLEEYRAQFEAERASRRARQKTTKDEAIV